MHTRDEPRPIPPLEKLKEILSYDPKTGMFRWVGSRRKGWNGKVAGHINRKGYIDIDCVFGRFLAHRLAWVFIYGDQAARFEPDHRDRNRSNNAQENLRLATYSQQCCNADRKLPSSGLRGACWDSAHAKKKWRSQIRHKGKSIFLGRFYTADAAHQAYMEFGKKLHGEFFTP